MAARKHRVQVSEEWRNKIATSNKAHMLMNRLMNNSLGKLEVPMSAGEIRSAEVVLDRIVPRLSAVDHSGEVNHNHVARVPEAQPDIDTWQHKHGNGATTIQ